MHVQRNADRKEAKDILKAFIAEVHYLDADCCSDRLAVLHKSRRNTGSKVTNKIVHRQKSICILFAAKSFLSGLPPKNHRSLKKH